MRLTMTNIMRHLALAAALGATSLFPHGVFAQGASWPTRSVRVIVPFLAGGSIDVVARTLAAELSARYHQQFVVENKAGAGGTIGTDLVAKSAADGYTLLLTAQGPLVINPFIMSKLPYDAQHAFAPVSRVVDAPNVLVASPKAGLPTFEAFLQRARSGGAPLTYATQGVGTTGHVTGALLDQALGISLTHVPYNGFPPILTDVMQGRVDLMIADTVNVGERVRTGQLAAVAVASPRRSSVLPEVPTFAEKGYPEIVAGPWFALLAPAGTSKSVRDKLSATVKEILAKPDIATRFHDMGLDIVGSTPDDLQSYMDKEYARWGTIIRKAGIQSAS